MSKFSLQVNGGAHTVDVDPSTPLLYVLGQLAFFRQTFRGGERFAGEFRQFAWAAAQVQQAVSAPPTRAVIRCSNSAPASGNCFWRTNTPVRSRSVTGKRASGIVSPNVARGLKHGFKDVNGLVVEVRLASKPASQLMPDHGSLCLTKVP